MKENDDAIVSKEITDIVVEDSYDDKGETTEVAEEEADMETVEELNKMTRLSLLKKWSRVQL